MDTLIVGEGACPFHKIVSAMKGSSSYVALLDNWSTLARKLQVSEEDIKKFRQSLLLDLQNDEDMLNGLLHKWKQKEGNKATLASLCNILKEIELVDISESIQTRFDKIRESMNISLTPTIPETPRYYITRTLSFQTVLKKGILSEESEDIFLFSGVDEKLELHHISSWVKGKQTGLSRRQIRQITCRFILLERDSHFPLICEKITNNNSVHWIEYRNNNFYWKQTHGNIRLVQKHVQKDQSEISEVDFVKDFFAEFNSKPICISDTPGMGKTLLIRSIAQMLQENHPERVVLYFQFRELIKDIRTDHIKQDDPNQLLQTVLNQVSQGQVVDAAKFRFELFLDGYDEVLSGQLKKAELILSQLRNLKNVRLIVTTRPHLRFKLEETLRVLSHSIQEFNEPNQIEFLKLFWISEGAVDSEGLDRFAIECLSCIKTKMSDLEREFAGIPLQCTLLAEAFKNDAITHFEGEELFNADFGVNSIFEMFKKMIDGKFKRRNDTKKYSLARKTRKFLRLLRRKRYSIEAVKEYHVYEAFSDIFPTWVKDKPKCIKQHKKMNMSVVYAAGLLEPGKSRSTFVHRTFAEYLIAEHLVKHAQTSCRYCVPLLFGEVLSKCAESDVHIHGLPEIFKSYKFEFQAICYFVDCRLACWELDDYGYNSMWRMISSTLGEDFLWHMPYKIMISSCHDDLCNCFDLIMKIGSIFIDEIEAKARLLLMITTRSEKVEMLTRVYDLVRLTRNKDDYANNNLRHISSIEILKVRSLHIAVHRGSFGLTEYLLGLYDQLARNVHCLLNFCVKSSINDTLEVINEKKQIIRMIIRCHFGKRALTEKTPDENLSPLFMPLIHQELIKCLLMEGADVNEVDRNGNSVLHNIASYGRYYSQVFSSNMYTNLLNLFLSYQIEHLHLKNSEEETPLHLAVKYLELEEDSLAIFKSQKANFNSFDKNGDSVLFSAIKAGCSVGFVETLMEYGCRPKMYHNRRNALHAATASLNLDVMRYLLENNICKVNDPDLDGNTAYHILGELRDSVPEIMSAQEILRQHGADPRAVNSFGKMPKLISFPSGGNSVPTTPSGTIQRRNEFANNFLCENWRKRKDVTSSMIKHLDDFIGLVGSVKCGSGVAHMSHSYVAEEISSVLEITQDLRDKAYLYLRIEEFETEENFMEMVITSRVFPEQLFLTLLEAKQTTAYSALFSLFQNENSRKVKPMFRNPPSDLLNFHASRSQDLLIIKTLNMDISLQRIRDTTCRVVDNKMERGSISLRKDTFALERYRDTGHKFVVVTENVTESIGKSYNVVEDRIEWKDLTHEFQKELVRISHTGLLSIEEVTKFCERLKGEDLVHLITKKSLPFCIMLEVLDKYVSALSQKERSFMEEYALTRKHFRDMDADAAWNKYLKNYKAIPAARKWNLCKDLEDIRVASYFVARAVIRRGFQNYPNIFKCKPILWSFHLEKFPVKIKTFSFKYPKVVQFIEYFIAKVINLDGGFKIDGNREFLEACAHSKYHNLLEIVANQNETIKYVSGPLVNLLCYNSLKLPIHQIETRKRLIRSLAEGNMNLLNARVSEEQLTPIMMPNVNLDLIKYLLDLGCDLKAVTVSRKMCFLNLTTSRLSSNNSLPLGQYINLLYHLVERNLAEEVFNRSSSSEFPLLQMLFYRDVDQAILSELKWAGVDFSVVDGNGNSAILKASRGGRGFNVLQALVEKHGASWMERNNYNRSILHHAAEAGSLDVIQHCLNAGFKVNDKDEWRNTPLIVAISEGKRNICEVVELLLNNKADVNAKDSSGKTALYYATKYLYERGNIINLLKEANNARMKLKHMGG